MYFVIDKYIDINCLDLIDAQAITKQKLLDAANGLVKQAYTHKGRESGADFKILIIQCGDNHLSQVTVDSNNNPAGALVNGIVDTL